MPKTKKVNRKHYTLLSEPALIYPHRRRSGGRKACEARHAARVPKFAAAAATTYVTSQGVLRPNDSLTHTRPRAQIPRCVGVVSQRIMHIQHDWSYRDVTGIGQIGRCTPTAQLTRHFLPFRLSLVKL
jgi:hypothetical protein